MQKNQCFFQYEQRWMYVWMGESRTFTSQCSSHQRSQQPGKPYQRDKSRVPSEPLNEYIRTQETKRSAHFVSLILAPERLQSLQNTSIISSVEMRYEALCLLIPSTKHTPFLRHGQDSLSSVSFYPRNLLTWGTFSAKRKLCNCSRTL